MKYGKLYTFHCERCGSNIELGNGKCAYCHSKVSSRTRQQADRQFRVFIEIDPQTMFYFHQVNEVSMNHEPNEIDCTMLEDIVPRKIITSYANSNANFSVLYTQDAMFKYEYIREKMKKTFDVFYEVDDMDRVFKFRAEGIDMGMPNISQNELLMGDIDLRIHDIDGWIDSKNIITVPKGRTCPNCGATLRKNFGLCDYCGGWVEFDDRF